MFGRTSVTITTTSAITMETMAAASRPYRLAPAFLNTGTQGFEDGTVPAAVAASVALSTAATWLRRAQKPPHSRFNPRRSEFSRLSRLDDCQHSHRLRLNRGALAICRGRLGGVKVQRVKAVIDATIFTRTRGLCTFGKSAATNVCVSADCVVHCHIAGYVRSGPSGQKAHD